MAPVYFLLHVPKCAGSSLIGHVSSHLGERAIAAPGQIGWRRNAFGNQYGFDPESPAFRAAQVFHGHPLSVSLKSLLPGREIRETVLLRDPVGYFVSMYNFRVMRARAGEGPESPPFPAWYAASRKNPISRFLLYRYFEQGVPGLYRFSSAGRLAWLEARLGAFWYVGSYRRVGELVGLLGQELGFPGNPKKRNVDSAGAVRVAELGEDLCHQIMRENAVDQLLFERWADRGADGAANPAPLTEGLSGADQPAQLFDEARIGALKAWQRHVQGFNRRGWG